jgi:acetyl-CoA carboxylase biotin carboxyl carrier protein
LDLKDIKELIALMRKNDLSEFEMEKDGFKIKLKKGFEPVVTQAPVAIAPAAVAAVAAMTPSQVPAAEVPKEASNLREIVSPMVGTFYASPAPDAAAFVQVGAEITEDSVVCIIEAMKVMNEIKAEVRGTVVEVLVENGKPVQFGQPLFRLR